MRPAFTADQALTAGRSSVRTTAVAPQQVSIPIYGNWCGPGVSGPAAPIDDLDACCMTHDNCYGREGNYSCSCDEALCNCVQNVSWGSIGKNVAILAIENWYCTTHPCF